MSSNSWRNMKVSEIGKVITGKTPKTAITEYYGGSTPFLTPSDNMDSKFVSSTSRTLSDSGLQSVRNCLLSPNSISVSCIGSDLGKVVLNRVPTVTNQQINSILPNKNFDPDFIYYSMVILGKKLNYLSKTSTAVPIINKSTFSSFSILIPPLEEQKAIAHVLSTLDDKIEVNNRINKTLEDMAQAIFKRWFVDFEFPNEEGEPYKSNGGEMVESELGMIPKGWKVGAFQDLVEVKYGKDHKKLDDGSIPVFGSGGIMRYVDQSIYENETVMIPRKGTLNNVIYYNGPFWSVDTMFYTKMKYPSIAKYIYFYITGKDLLGMNTGSAVPSMTTETLNKLPILLPLDLIRRFDIMCEPLFNQVENLKSQNNAIANMRDNLLPKLMSGEIRVPIEES